MALRWARTGRPVQLMCDRRRPLIGMKVEHVGSESKSGVVIDVHDDSDLIDVRIGPLAKVGIGSVVTEDACAYRKA